MICEQELVLFNFKYIFKTHAHKKDLKKWYIVYSIVLYAFVKVSYILMKSIHTMNSTGQHLAKFYLLIQELALNEVC